MEPKGFFGLQIMRDVVLEDCFEVEQACIGASTAYMSSQLRSTLAVGRVMKSVLSITRGLVIRQVTLKNHTAEAKNLDELVRVVSIIQLWLAQ